MTINEYESMIWKFLSENSDFCLVKRTDGCEIVPVSMVNPEEKYIQSDNDPCVIENLWVVMDGEDRIVADKISSVRQAIKLLE